jgi:hypothetical protein
VSEDGPFASFVPSTEAAPEPPKAGKRKGKDKSTKPKVKATAPAEPKAKRTRKAKESRPMKIDLALAVNAVAGLNEDDCFVLNHLVTYLGNAAKKKVRIKIVAALAKIFA